MYTRTSWSLMEFEEYYNIAIENHGKLMLIVWNMNTFQQYPHYIIQLSSLETVLAEIEEDENLDIIAVVEIKDTFKETLISSEVHCTDEIVVESFWQKWLHCRYCKTCDRKAFIEPFYDYVVGMPLVKCPHCGSYVLNPKRQEWKLMSDWEKIRAVAAGLVITGTHGFMGGIMLGLIAIFLGSIFSYDSNSFISSAMILGAVISVIATLYCRFGVIFSSLKRTKGKDYLNLLYDSGAASRYPERAGKKTKEVFSWEQLQQRSMLVDYHRSDGEIEHAFLKHLMETDGKIGHGKIERYLFHIGIIYSETGQTEGGLWIKKSMPGQGALLRALAMEYKPEVFADFPLEEAQMPLGKYNRMILLSMDKEKMLEAMERYCIENAEKTETDALADNSADHLFDLLQIMYHMEEWKTGNFYFALGIGCLEK